MIPESDRLEYFALAREHDPSVAAQKIWRNDGPFTLRGEVSPTSPDRWLIDFHERRGCDDCFYCPCNNWTILYASHTELKWNSEIRALLFAAAMIVTSRLEEIVVLVA
jgi:hypothetical protein